MRTKEEIIRSVVIGHAVGDALGVPVEFCTREELRAQGRFQDKEKEEQK